MRLLHISDTHSTFPKLAGRFETVIHTGDFFPNSIAVFSGNKTQEMLFQEEWLEKQANNIKSWLRGYPFLFVLGNHDFMSPKRMEEILLLHGIQAISLHEKVVTFNSINFYGFPYVPFINGMWNYECDPHEMYDEVEKMVEVLNSTYVDVVAAHAPMHGKLDVFQSHLGSSVIANAFDYKISRDMTPANYFHGHIHESYGMTMRNGVLISNAATTQNIVEV